MSSQPPFNENLSAYFDHEVSPEERLELESRLEQSPAARQELHEFGELSRLLQETATESASPELAPSIRRRIEQETLLASPETVPVKRVPSMLRYRIAIAISACSSVAALVLFVLLLNTGSPESSWQLTQSDRMVLSPAKESALNTTVARNDKMVAARSNEFSFQAGTDIGKPGQPHPVPSVELQLNKRGMQLPKVEAPKMEAEEKLAMRSMNEKSPADFSVHNTLAELNSAARQLNQTTQGLAASSGIPSHIPLDSIRIGDVLPYFRDIDGKVAVIEVRVVDVKQALGTMELLLAQNNIPVDQLKQSEVERQLQRTQSMFYKAADSKTTADQSKAELDQQLFAVYVEATDAQLASTLEEFQRGLKRDQKLSLALQPAITEQSLKEEVASLPQLLTQQSASYKKDKSVNLGLQPETEVSDQYINNPENRKTATEGLAQAKPQAPAVSQRSYQMRYRMQVPAEQAPALKRMVQSGALKKKEADQKSPSFADVPLMAAKPTGFNTANSRQAGKQSAESLISEAPVKVLFVFKNSETPALPTAPQ
ncbi:anti-sigma factor family protein [Gimesia sp.]|uniref:anti-sigma factor family protein n=1 Tax=Gimesia sp. TaxID=2024833 RepID=UPI003A8F13BA